MRTQTRGQRRHLVTLDNPTYVPQTDGTFTETWTALDPPTAYASIVHAPSRDEQAIVGTVTATRPQLITLDYHPQVTEHTRVSFNGRAFSVVGVANSEERNLELVLTCVERQP